MLKMQKRDEEMNEMDNSELIVRAVENQADIIVKIFRGVIEDPELYLTDEQKLLMPTIVTKHIRRWMKDE